MSLRRPAQGCWTCRLRHKKCDEAKPSCRACGLRGLSCHGYGTKPAWFDGGDQERTELVRIKSVVKQSLRQRMAQKSVERVPTSPSNQFSTSGDRIASYREAELLMHYIDHVFPLQFRFYKSMYVTCLAIYTD
jgi:hypothetical protein